MTPKRVKTSSGLPLEFPVNLTGKYFPLNSNRLRRPGLASPLILREKLFLNHCTQIAILAVRDGRAQRERVLR